MRLALIGGKGMLAKAVTGLAPPDYDLVSFDLPDFDITDRNQVLSVLAELRPEVIINCAAFTNVDGSETQEDLANLVNGTAVGYLAVAAKEINATLVHISTDYVFAGDKKTPYVEEDATHPQSAYGRSKLPGEQAILDSGLQRFFIIRTSWLYGPAGKNFVETIIRLAKEREELRVVADQVGCPTFTYDLAAAIFNLLQLDNAHGLYHFADAGQCSWHEFAEAIVDEEKAVGEMIVAQRVVPIRSEEYPLPAPRPAWSVFSKEKYKAATGAAVPDWRKSLKEYVGNR